MSSKIRRLNTKVIEEAGELIQALAKAERFGYLNFKPDNWPCHKHQQKEEWCDYNGPGGFMGHTCGSPITNLAELEDEFDDLRRAFDELTEYLWKHKGHLKRFYYKSV